jgi:hypothetical protein
MKHALGMAFPIRQLNLLIHYVPGPVMDSGLRDPREFHIV